MIGGRLITTVIGLASLAVLSRLLEPEDFGLVAMAATFIALGEIFRDAGLTSAAIQAKTLTREQRDNLFWINTGLGLILTIAFLALSPIIAIFFKESSLSAINAALSFSFLLSGMSTQYRASLARDMRFISSSVIDIASTALGTVAAIVAATLGMGAWSLVIQTHASAITGLIALVCYAQWVPRRYDRSAPMGSLLNFGLPLLGTTVVQYLATNIDSLILGRLFGASTLGFYNRAVRVAKQPLNAVRSPLSMVALSTLSKHQDNEALLVRFARVGQLLVGYPLLFLAGLLAVFSNESIYIFLGDGWGQTAPYLALISIGEGLNTLAMTGGWLYTSMGKSRQLLRYTIFSAVVRIGLILSLTLTIGPIGAAVAYGIAPMILWPISIIWAGKATGLNTAELLWGSLRIFAVAAVAGAATKAVFSTIELPLLATLFVGATLYAAIMLGCAAVPAVRRDYADFVHALKLLRR